LIGRNAAWLLGCRVLGDLLNLFFFIIISREFGPAGVGAYSYSFAVTGFILVIGSMGIEDFGQKEYVRLDAAHRLQFIAELLGTQIVIIGAAIVGVGVFLLLTSPSRATLGIMASLAYFQAAVGFSSALFIPAMGQQHMVGRAVIDLVSRVVAFVYAGVAIYVWRASIPVAMVGYVLAATLLLELSRRSAISFGGGLKIAMSRQAVTKVIIALWSFAAVEVLALLFARAGVIVLALKNGDAAAGVYATGLRLIEAGVMPLAFVGIALYPQLSRFFRDDKAAFQNIGLNYIWGVLVAGVLLSWGLYFVAPLLLVPILGSKYAGTDSVIMMMSALGCMWASEIGMGRVMFAADLQIARAVGISLGAASALVLNLLLVPKFAVTGAILAALASYVLINGVYFIALKGRMPRGELSGAVLIPFFALAAGAAVVWLCDSRGMPFWTQGLASATAFILIAGGGFWTIRGRRLLAARVHPNSTTTIP
jgi:O-antigen/teichoic acid export membrane protein